MKPKHIMQPLTLIKFKIILNSSKCDFYCGKYFKLHSSMIAVVWGPGLTLLFSKSFKLIYQNDIQLWGQLRGIWLTK